MLVFGYLNARLSVCYLRTTTHESPCPRFLNPYPRFPNNGAELRARHVPRYKDHPSQLVECADRGIQCLKNLPHIDYPESVELRV